MGNLTKFERTPTEAGYIAINKEFRGKKPHTTISLTKQGRTAFRGYKKSLQQVLNDLLDFAYSKLRPHKVILREMLLWQCETH